ncbi:BGTF surface domain-containing protein [Halorussus salinisoli]|uniref:BGTF surface domain-containing protein n=1 Tax=Halorussus salinisoli TaxID=2558242 RepID=UPI0010C1C73E|nr:BGTF surface domain-containing protein [Halorussus salinisoli]
MTRTRTSVLLTALLVVSAVTAGITGATMSDAETTYQAQDDGLGSVAVGSEEVFWSGQFLRFSGGEQNASEVWAIRRVENGQVGQLATEVLLDGNGSAVFSSSDLDGRYVVVDGNERPVVFQNGVAQRTGDVNDAAFEITNQSLDVTFADATVRNDDSPEARTDLQLESNRAGYGFYLFSDQLSASQLADVFSSVEVRDGRAVATRNASDDAGFAANFTGVEPGTYNVTVFTSDGTAQSDATISVTEPVEGTASLADGSITEQRGDVVRFNVNFDGTDRATVSLGSEQVRYLSRFTVVDANEDGVATVEIDTFRAGLSPDSPGISVVGEDNLTDFQLVTDPVPGRLDAATYPIEVSVGATRSDVGSILLSERSTEGIQVWTAPDRANVGNATRLSEVATQDQNVAYQDWAIVQVQASGLYSYVQNLSDLNDNETGLSMNLLRVGEINVPSEQVPLDRANLVVDEENDQFFLVIDSNELDRDTTYRANFTITDANPYVSADNTTSLVTNFTVVERNVTFDQPVEVASASDVTISGESSVAAGTELTIEATNTGQNPFLKRQTATVSEDGTWEATFDFSDVSPNTNFTVSTNEPQANATGTVVSGEGAGDGDAGEETTPADEETTPAADGETTAAEETPDDEETPADEETEEADGATDAETETPAAEDDTTTTETTTVEASAPASGFGPVSLLVGLAVLLAGSAFAARRR